MSSSMFVIIVAVCAFIPALLFFWNVFLYRRPPAPNERYQASILIPARNEERCIGAAVDAALRTSGVDIEVLVLDDHSDDATPAIVNTIALRDRRVRLLQAPPLPPGWCGKQFACHVLASQAASPVFCFIDADVLLTPTGLASMIAGLKISGSGLVSGFPQQVTETPLEQLLLPLMHFLLLGFLPVFGMRRSLHPSFGAGCGQIFVADRAAYFDAGGHASIRNSRHDGITLPKAFRRAGIPTDLFDATAVASCRMYRSAAEVFFGLLKNASEGLASPGRILPFSFLLFAGQVLPLALAVLLWLTNRSGRLIAVCLLAALASYLPRLMACFRYRQPFLASLFHPAAITLLLIIQWYAFIRILKKTPSTWKGRSYSTT